MKKSFVFAMALCCISSPAISCMNRISPADLDKVLATNDPSQAETLTYKGDDFKCFDGIDLRVAEEVDNMVVDFIREENSQSCEAIEDCDLKFASLVCERGQAINNHDQLKVYCAVEMLKKDGKKLVESPVKKAAREAALQAEKDAAITEEANRKQAIKELKEAPPVDEPVGTTVAQLRNEQKELTRQVNRLRAILKSVLKE